MLMQIACCALLVAINQICFRVAGYALKNGSTVVTVVFAVTGVLLAAIQIVILNKVMSFYE